MKYLAPTSEYLNVGCGTVFHPAWLNIDLVSTHPQVIAYDIRPGLPFHDGTFAVVYHSHILEHLSPEHGEKMLRECYRVLKPGGILRVVVPDLEMAARLYLGSLEEVLAQPDQTVAIEHYEWGVINLIDQMVRGTYGGQLGAFLRRALRDPDYIVDIKHQISIGRLKANETAFDHQPGRRQQITFQHALRAILNRMRVRLLQGLMGHDEYAEWRFRQSGEIHRWMYDRYSLPRLLKKIGFNTVQVVAYNESQIPEWNSYQLDSLPDGAIRKAGSLFVEGRK